MKVIVMDVSDNMMMVVNQNGYISRLAYDGVSDVGSEIEIQETRVPVVKNKKRQLKITMFCLFLICFLFAGYRWFSYSFPVTYLVIDSNPSCMFVLNKLDRVIGVQYFAVDTDGKMPGILAFRNKNVQDAVSLYLKDVYDKNDKLLFTVFCEESYRYNQINNVLKKDQSSTFMIHRIKKNEFDQAMKLNISPGKYMIYEKIAKYNSDIKMIQIQKLSVQQNLDLLQGYEQVKIEKEKPLAQSSGIKKTAGISKNNPMSGDNKLISAIGHEVSKGIANDLRNKISVVKAIIQDVSNANKK